MKDELVFLVLLQAPGSSKNALGANSFGKPDQLSERNLKMMS
jgi:hypothetical protein